MKVNIAWGIRTAVCANEFVDDYVSFVSLSLYYSMLISVNLQVNNVDFM